MITEAQTAELLKRKQPKPFRSPGAGRPPGTLRGELPVYESMSQAVGATGIPLEAFKSAKKRGCPAMKEDGSVVLRQFLEWIFAREVDENGKEINTDWRKRWEKARALQAEQDLAISKGELIAISEVKQSTIAWSTRLRSVLDGRLKNELPARVAGKTSEQIAEAITEVLEEAYKLITT